MMMDLAADLPVTLVIKAPNQRVGDQTVECMLGWTVRKLKQHLTTVYPSQPKENHQKLIYSGKLLADHLTLKEVLRQFEDGSNKHTVHLVCASSQSSPVPSNSRSSSSPQNHSRESSSSSGISEVDGIRYQDISEIMGLRRRGQGHASPTPSQSTSSTQSQHSQNVFSPYMGQFPQGFGSYPGGVIPPEAAMMFTGSPTSGMVYSPEQYLWMQQMYAQYMAQYMQYYQQGMYPTPPSTPATPTTDQPANQNAADQQDPPMNAGGDVDDEEFGQRDWLDYVYTFCRFMVLMGIVYFYSNFTRFFFVFALFFFVYLYQTGWFRFRRHRQEEPEQQQEDRNQQQQQETPQNNTESQETTETTEANTESTDNTTEPPPPPPEPAGPGVIKVVWTFFSTFFTSLIPQPPPAVNAN